MRDRLIEMIAVARNDYYYNADELHEKGMAVEESSEEFIADYLLANGVIVPPCKVGDTVYFPIETDDECGPYVDVGTVFAIGINERLTMWISVRYESGLKYYHTADDFGKTVFLTREEAEQALEKLKGGAE